jgi:hypothetical protein
MHDGMKIACRHKIIGALTGMSGNLMCGNFSFSERQGKNFKNLKKSL